MNALIDWDDVDNWGQPGSNVTVGSSDDLGHGRHSEGASDQ